MLSTCGRTSVIVPSMRGLSRTELFLSFFFFKGSFELEHFQILRVWFWWHCKTKLPLFAVTGSLLTSFNEVTATTAPPV